ncbi:MAG: ABC transporter ATP-binding protein [Alphaproteobacteria bacterium]|nr:ABC transporter ATP-binding protein [Alphaproteobacteria bacterium]
MMTNITNAKVQTAVAIRKLSKTYSAGSGGTLALSDIDLDIRGHEFVSVIGPSGCGKSTLLRIIGGLLPYDGAALVNGAPIEGPSPDISIVFQKSNLLPWLTTEANLNLGAQIRKKPITPADTSRMIDLLGLKGFEKNHPHQLSGGMQQRVSLGQALIVRPSILLLDEPFGALDALTRDRLNIELLRIWEEARQTVFLVTHSITEAIFLSDRVVVMSPRPGRIIEDVRIDLPRPRAVKETRADPRFSRYVNQLSELMGVV